MGDRFILLLLFLVGVTIGATLFGNALIAAIAGAGAIALVAAAVLVAHFHRENRP